MRPIQPPRLKLRSARRGRRALWVIKDCEREISTGFGQSERAKTEIALANYITRTRQPSFGDGHPDQVLIGDCLAVYCDKHGPTIARPDGLSLEIERLAEFFGDRHVGDVTAELCRGYVDWRCAQTDRRATVTAGRKIKPTTARRELLTLSAALNWCFRNKRLDRAVVITLPQVAERRERYLTRNEVAALLWAALGFNQDGTRNRFRVNPHLVRFILIGFYTGTRHDAILRLHWMANTTGGWFDLAAGRTRPRPPRAARRPGPRRGSCPISAAGAGYRPNTWSSMMASQLPRNCAEPGMGRAQWLGSGRMSPRTC